MLRLIWTKNLQRWLAIFFLNLGLSVLMHPVCAYESPHHKLHSKKTHHRVLAHKKKHLHASHRGSANKNKRNLNPTPVNVSHLSKLSSETAIAHSGFVASLEKHLVTFVRNTITTLRYSVYKLGGTHFDPSHGVYVVDCSDYVDNILQAVYPHAYMNLVATVGSGKPTTEHYFDFFNGLSDDSKHWNKIDDVSELQPGDILVFRYKNMRSTVAGGHVMMVMDRPIRALDAYLVRVADSAEVGHSQDTRPPHVSGIGIGTLMLKENPKTGQPSAYAWRVGSHWKNNVKFAMARPLDFETHW